MQYKYLMVSVVAPDDTYALKYDAKYGHLRLSAPKTCRKQLDEINRRFSLNLKRARVRNSTRYALAGYNTYVTATNLLVDLKEAGWKVTTVSDLGGM